MAITSAHSPHPDLRKIIDHAEFEVWLAPFNFYDETEKLRPTVYLELSGWGSDLLPVRNVVVVNPQDFATLPSSDAERIVVRWPPEQDVPPLRPGWWLQLVRILAATGHHTLVVVDNFNDAARLGYAARQLREAIKLLGLQKAKAREPSRGAANDHWDVI